MARNFFVLALFTGIPTAAAAQDMPLSQILIDGEGWTKVENPSMNLGRDHLPVRSPDGNTEYQWEFDPIGRGSRYIGARQTADIGRQLPFAPYCQLRMNPGQEPRVTGLTVDRDGRIYAATLIGIQVFDPTGRLCGVMHAPAPGPMQSLRFEDDRLTVWIGEVKYARKLRTTGVK